MRDMEAGQSDHTVGLLTPVDASARGVDQPQHHDNLPEHAASRQSKPHEMDCFDYFCRRAELLVHGNQRCFATSVPAVCVCGHAAIRSCATQGAQPDDGHHSTPVPGRQPYGALSLQPREGTHPALVPLRVGTFRTCCFKRNPCRMM